MTRPFTTRPARTLGAALALALPAAALAGCGNDSGTDASGKARSVAVRLTPDGCAATPASVPAGPVTFRVSNDGADAVTELELLSGNRILGEKENLAPGLSGSFTLNLKAGSYALSCPGAKKDRTGFTVTRAGTSGQAGAPATTDPALAQAVDKYDAYVRSQVAQLVTATTAFAAAVQGGDVDRAKQLYAPTRAFYERIEPVAESFGDLDPAIDARINDVADPKDWTGFHRIEQALWERGSTADMGPVATRLVADVGRLKTAVDTADYQPAQLANGASELLDEVAKSKITGEEERYSHTDLVDFAANIDGAKEAFTLLEPALRRVDPDLASAITDRFAAVTDSLAKYRAGSGYVSYTALSKQDVATLSSQVDALAEPLSKVAAAIVGPR